MSDGLDIVLVISLGYSSEKSVVEKVRDNDIKIERDWGGYGIIAPDLG